jgi:hypothetical protein
LTIPSTQQNWESAVADPTDSILFVVGGRIENKMLSFFSSRAPILGGVVVVTINKIGESVSERCEDEKKSAKVRDSRGIALKSIENRDNFDIEVFSE